MRMRPATTRVALALVIVVALLAGLVVLAPVSDAPVGIAAADNHTEDRPVNVSAERSENMVVVSVSAHAFDSDTQNASIDVSLDDYDGQESIDGAVRNVSGNYEFETSVRDLVDDANVTESRPSITVSYPSGSATIQVDVRLIQFGNPGDISEDGGTYRLPVELVGHADGDTIPVRVSEDGESVTFDATFACDDNCQRGSLLVDPEDFRETASPLRQQQFEAYSDTDYLTTSEQFDLSAASRPSFGVSEEALVIRHPLVFGEETYIIEATTEDPAGRYVVERTASETDGLGELDASEVVTRAGTVEVTVTHVDSDETIFANEQPNLTPDTPEVTYDPENRSFDFSSVSVSLPDTVETVWLNDSGDIQRFDTPETGNQRLILPLENATPPFQVLVVGNGTTVRASVQPNSDEAATGAGNQTDEGSIGDRTDAVLTGLLYLIVMGMVGLVVIPVFGVVGRESRSTLGLAAHALGIVVVLAGFVLVWQFHGEWYGVHAFILAEFAGIGLLAGTFQTFDVDTPQGLLFNFGLATVVFFVVIALVVLQSIPDAVAASMSALGGTLGAYGGFILGMKAITPKHPVSIQLIDDQTHEPVRTDEYVTANYQSGRGSTKVKVSGGAAKATLKEGNWQFSSGADAIEGTKTKRVTGEDIVEIPVSRAGAEFMVESMVDDSPLSDATVTLAPGSESAEDGTILRPIGDGIHRGDLPAGVSTATVRVTCDRYQSEERTFQDIGNSLRGTIKLAPKQGTLEVTVTLEGDPVADIPVVVSARSDIVKEGTRRERTNSRGQVVESGVVVGEYDVTVELPAGADEFEMDDIDNPVTVAEDETTTVEVDVRFAYELPPEARRRLGDLRDRLESVSSHPRSDVAIPTFYASVVHELLDTVEDVPRNPALFLQNDHSPQTTIDALLAAAEAGVEAIDEAMSSKQNADLFAACGDMDRADVVWEGSFDLASFFERVEQDSGRRRADIAQRLDEVDDTISRELRDLSEVRPAQDMWEQTRDMARDTSRSDPEMAAITVLGLGLLDAIEALFDRQPLRERMTRTVF